MFNLGDRLPPPVDYSRHDGLLDHGLMARTHVACIGVGGASGLIQLLTRCGIGRFTLVDFDHVAPTNPATQAHDQHDIHRAKVLALADRLHRLDPAVHVTAIRNRYQELTSDEHAALWRADMVLAMTDKFDTQALINRDAVAAKTDAVFAITYVHCQQVEITATFVDTIAAGRGCHRCHTKIRYDAYADGFTNPSLIPSHALAAEYLNALLATLVVSRLHARAGSRLPIVETAREFSLAPCLISSMAPRPAAGVLDAGLAPFTTRLYALDSPEGWTCPDCGTPGVVPELPRPMANPGPGTIQERSASCVDPSCPAAFAAND